METQISGQLCFWQCLSLCQSRSRENVFMVEQPLLTSWWRLSDGMSTLPIKFWCCWQAQLHSSINQQQRKSQFVSSRHQHLHYELSSKQKVIGEELKGLHIQQYQYKPSCWHVCSVKILASIIHTFNSFMIIIFPNMIWNNSKSWQFKLWQVSRKSRFYRQNAA